MALGSGSNTEISYIAETVVGTTPASPTIDAVAVNDFSINLSKEVFTDPSLRADRQAHFLKHGNKTIAGDITVTMLTGGVAPAGHAAYDPWLESLMHSTFSSNVLKIGNDQSTFTLEKKLTDLAGGVQYFRYTGCECTALNLTIALDAPVIAKFSFQGLDEDAVTSTALATPTLRVAPTLEPIVHINASNDFQEGGITTSVMTAFSLDIKTELDVNHALGNAVAKALTPKKTEVTGEATYYFEDSTIYNKFVNETATSLTVVLNDGTNTLTIDMSSVVYNEASQAVENDGTLIVTMPFTAIYNDADASTVVITRS